ncbi:S-layer homology domain-containing protein [Brevibacillus sp. SYSU BS000544]|uniref:S-layer homology domain-containing protein n=1 Tax=Brevibacillus sp. SYSU BS000544 TaxID=3416443 RepID=UPI003CE55A44
MKKQLTKMSALAVVAILGANALMGGSTLAAASNPNHKNIVAAKADYGIYEKAIQELIRQGVLQGYAGSKMKSEQNVTRAELAKMVVLALQLESKKSGSTSMQDVNPGDWYQSYVNTIVELGGMSGDNGKFLPNKPVTHAELSQVVAKALQRDVMSVQYWMKGMFSANKFATRGETSQLLLTAQKSIRSEAAKITSIRSLNKVTMELTFDRPMTMEDESLDVSLKNFVFDHDLAIVNQPRLKTGSFSTYILPTKTQMAGTTYTLNYKGRQSVNVEGNEELIRTNEARQVDNDSFEIEILKSDSVTDYGYVISAYSAGRGKNAFILDENNMYNGQPFQIVSSLRSRSVTITPDGGEPMTAAYLPFTQSTDGKQEPKFRLPNGEKFKSGVKYTVTSDWLEIKNPTFIAQETAPLQIMSVSQGDAATLNVTLANDPGDEIFVSREVKLIGSDGSELKAQYTLQSRKGATGKFALQNGAKLVAGVTYSVQPVGDWAVASNELMITVK